MVMTIRSNVKKLVLDEVVITLHPKEVRQKDSKSTNEATWNIEREKQGDESD
jgi:hypothetical protein